VCFDNLVGYLDERLVWALSAFDLRLSTDAFDPFIGTRRCIAGAALLYILPSDRENIGSTAKKAPKQTDLPGRIGFLECGSRIAVRRSRAGLLQFRQPSLERNPLPIELGKLGPDLFDLAGRLCHLYALLRSSCSHYNPPNIGLEIWRHLLMILMR
jgi:hypothetical protein